MQAVPRERSEALIEACMLELFRRIPLLLGFSIDEDLAIAGVEVHTWPGLEWGEDFHEEVQAEISAALADVMIEQEDAAELLRGRTLARTFQ